MNQIEFDHYGTAEKFAKYVIQSCIRGCWRDCVYEVHDTPEQAMKAMKKLKTYYTPKTSFRIVHWVGSVHSYIPPKEEETK